MVPVEFKNYNDLLWTFFGIEALWADDDAALYLLAPTLQKMGYII